MSESARVRCNLSQKMYLVDFMVANKDLALRSVTSQMSLVEYYAQWAKLAEELANFGPNKTVEQWLTTWRDLKSRAKSADAKRSAALAETGSPDRPVPELSNINKKILSIIDRTTSEGSVVPESSISGVQLPPVSLEEVTVGEGLDRKEDLNDAKIETNQNLDPSSDTKPPMEYYIHVKVENEIEDLPVKEIKKETEFQKIEIKKDPGSPESNHSISPVWFEVPVERGNDSPEIKYSNTQDYLDIGETVISEPSVAPASNSTEYKGGTKKREKKQRKIKSGEKQYICNICDRRFSCNDYLKQHLRIHTGEKPFKCQACDYRCAVGSRLKRHMRTHTGEKPHKCEACDYRCALYSSLKKHMRRHTGEKPYKCEACDYRCTVDSSLKKHMRTHTRGKPYKCETCDFRCTNGSNLKRHMKTHVEEKM